MRTVTKTYKNGDIIYRQGEESLWAFEILEGSVELIKETAEGQSTLAKVKAGDLFATIFEAVGIDHSHEYHVGSRPIPITDFGCGPIKEVLA